MLREWQILNGGKYYPDAFTVEQFMYDLEYKEGVPPSRVCKVALERLEEMYPDANYWQLKDVVEFVWDKNQ